MKYLLVLILTASALHSAPAGTVQYLLNSGRIITPNENCSEGLLVSPYVRFIYPAENNGIFYLGSESADNSGRIIAGLILPGRAALEKELDLLWEDSQINKIFSHGDSLYIHYSHILEKEPSVLRLNFNDYSITELAGVADIKIAAGRTIILTRKGNDYILNINGNEITLFYTGLPLITGVTDDKILTVSDGTVYDFVDLRECKILYSYPVKNSSPEAPKFNLEITISDVAPDTDIPSMDQLVFYKIYIDGMEKGRTEPIHPQSTARINEYLTEGSHHAIGLERWELNRTKGKYERSNNISQPGLLKIYIPQNKSVNLVVKYDGSRYIIERTN